jgi:flagellum-specific peptidoglycan hydrolase FlgJ
MKDWIRDMTIIIIVFILGLILGVYLTHTTTIKSKNIQHNEYQTNDSSITEHLKYCFTKHKIKFSHIVLAQAKLESNNFKSDIFKTNNNMFGMKVPAQRFTFAINDADFANYAKFANLEDCVRDYKSWQKTYATLITTEDGYFQLLNNIYAEDTDYVNKLKKLIK